MQRGRASVAWAADTALSLARVGWASDPSRSVFRLARVPFILGLILSNNNRIKITTLCEAVLLC